MRKRGEKERSPGEKYVGWSGILIIGGLVGLSIVLKF